MPPSGPMAPHHRRTVWTVIVCTLLVVALATGTTVYAVYRHLDGNLRAGVAIKHRAEKRAAGPKAPLNILLLGVDRRDCPGCAVDNEAGADGSDTTILLHVAADRRSAYGISIPRDTLVDPVPCTAGAHYLGTGKVQWNAAFTAGGAACTAEQLEGSFGVFVDGYLTMNFGGFQDMVDEIGGVDVCIPVELSDPVYAKVTFEPGRSVHLDGKRALAYFRLRHVLAGTDTGRIKRQQGFITAMVNKVLSGGMLMRPDRLLGFAGALTSSMTASPDLASVKDLVRLAREVRHIDPAEVRFVTVPSRPYDVPRTDPRWGRVELLPAAARLWQRVVADEPLPPGIAADSVSAATPPGSPTRPAASPGSGTPTASPTDRPVGTAGDAEARAAGVCS